MNALTTTIISHRTYSSFIEKVDHSAFHRIEWLKTIESYYSVELVTLGYYDGDQLIAVSPLQKKKIGPFTLWGAPLRKCAIPPSTPFCIPVEKSLDIIESFLGWCKNHNAKFLQITIPNGIDFTSIVTDNTEELNNLEMRLTEPLANIYKRLSKGTRWCIRKAVRQGVRLHWRSSIKVIDEQKLLLKDTYGNIRNNASSTYPIEFYQTIFNKRDDINLRILSASHEGETVASLWVFVDKSTCYYWDAASRYKARDLYANHLLVWSLIKWAHKNNFKTFDFVGGGTGRQAGSRPGIGRFKRSMGATGKNYHIAYWYSPLLQFALKSYRSYSSIRHRARTKIQKIKPS